MNWTNGCLKEPLVAYVTRVIVYLGIILKVYLKKKHGSLLMEEINADNLIVQTTKLVW